MKQSQKNLDFALQSGRMGTWEIDLVTNVVKCSNEMLYLWGVNSNEFDGDRSILQSRVHPDDLEKMRAAIDKAIANEVIYEMEYRIFPFPGLERWVISRGRCTFAPGTKKPIRFSGVVYDITEKKVKEEELKAAIKIRDQFLMMASHELRTPLTCMQLQLQVAEWDLKHRFPEAFTFERIETNIKKNNQHLSRITRLVDQILDESKISQGRLIMLFEHFDLSEMVVDLIEQYKVTAEFSGVEVLFSPTEKVSGMWDRFRLEQVFLNLLINGIRYGNRKPIHITVKKEGNKALLSVRDEGIGIKSEDQKRIFERFERASHDKEVNGLGLGLYIANKIVTDHGGEIRLESEFGKGSKFIVVLPL
ncbi:sensor histidine kinase [Peredibacter starrii]|uniref:histidine kinase n=1 Tax=Peredibacter starrii TaxID=28202 RepID=A0AAX4HM46_9BACT|nr:PAS domain-containing sensor histidine kinase [Peredibacter starrii]WPU64334.1 PAS domain-containing sensor histidine kinase [Peredibacter starrii]